MKNLICVTSALLLLPFLGCRTTDSQLAQESEKTEAQDLLDEPEEKPEEEPKPRLARNYKRLPFGVAIRAKTVLGKYLGENKKEEAVKFLLKHDINEDKKLNLLEVKSVVVKSGLPNAIYDAKQCTLLIQKYFDLNGDKFADQAEIKNMLRYLKLW